MHGNKKCYLSTQWDVTYGNAVTDKGICKRVRVARIMPVLLCVRACNSGVYTTGERSDKGITIMDRVA